LLFFRHSAQNSLDNRQVNYARFAHSDEKIDGASAALSLCGIALIFSVPFFYHLNNIIAAAARAIVYYRRKVME